MKLEVGMFVKYTRGAINGYVPPRIARIVDCSDNELIKIDNGQVILRSDVIKASHNLIDLIELGDYVNGELVVQVSNDKGWVFTEPVYFDEYRGEEKHYCYNNSEIKSVVTKEQFESMKYIVERDD